jgi:hypothetical protein
MGVSASGVGRAERSACHVHLIGRSACTLPPAGDPVGSEETRSPVKPLVRADRELSELLGNVSSLHGLGKVNRAAVVHAPKSLR